MAAAIIDVAKTAHQPIGPWDALPVYLTSVVLSVAARPMQADLRSAIFTAIQH